MEQFYRIALLVFSITFYVMILLMVIASLGGITIHERGIFALAFVVTVLGLWTSFLLVEKD